MTGTYTYLRMTASAAVAAMAAAIATPDGVAAQQEPSRGPLDGLEAIYGLAVDPNVAGTLLLGTQYGLLRAAPDGLVERVDTTPVAIAGLAVSPADSRRLMLSGYAGAGKPAGMLGSSDGGASWTVVPGTDSAASTVVTSMSISRLDQARMAGLSGQIQLSDDGGASWSALGTTPDQTFSVALSGQVENRLFAATMGGLMLSGDGGSTWTRSFAGEGPATMVATLSGGRVAGFIYGTGLIMADEGSLDWNIVGTGFEGRYLTTLIEDPASGETLYGVADSGAILMSRDNGAAWISFEGNDKATPQRIAEGRDIYADTCQACHGVGGIGESPDDPTARDEYGFKAPALNNDMHGWHHSDIGLLTTISKGSARNERMMPWGEVLTDDEIASVLAYVKSTWTINSLACQGSRHMRC